jgi:uncharacterized protein (DUF362 family)
VTAEAAPTSAPTTFKSTDNLCVVDATIVLGTNGPAGPGDLLKPQKIVAGTDPVAVDAYCVTLHSRKPQDAWRQRSARRILHRGGQSPNWVEQKRTESGLYLVPVEVEKANGWC